MLFLLEVILVSPNSSLVLIQLRLVVSLWIWSGLNSITPNWGCSKNHAKILMVLLQRLFETVTKTNMRLIFFLLYFILRTEKASCPWVYRYVSETFIIGSETCWLDHASSLLTTSMIQLPALWYYYLFFSPIHQEVFGVPIRQAAEE